MKYETPVGLGTPEEGRKEIPLETALHTQQKLLELMIPDSVRPYLTDSDTDPIRLALGERWMEKYILGFNGFTEFCNEKSTDRAFMQRAVQGELTPADYDEMIAFFEQNEHGEPFFASEEEVGEFLKPFLH